MGIKGIYKELGEGRRVSLAALATEHLARTHQPLRLAIDISIWQFQALASRGGANPAIRTLFYRLARLVALGVRAVFVFDGPQKPAFKRGKRSTSHGGGSSSVATAMARRVVELFGFVAHDAPGEAEAECALLWREGVVDLVVSEDVDTLMFGCGRLVRRWGALETGGAANGPPTHVSLYHVSEGGEEGSAFGNVGGREGMVLIALMSGGDYVPGGVPGCGIKVACQAARAGFGKSLCGLKTRDVEGLNAWRERLRRELRTNESGAFRSRHAALRIPDDFPDMEVLRYYTHPVVSNLTGGALDRVGAALERTRKPDLDGLKRFTRETFDWAGRIGAVKFIRVMAPGLLVYELLAGSAAAALAVQAITSWRAHHKTDAMPELRVAYTPIEVVPLDLDKEPDSPSSTTAGRGGLALNSDDDDDAVTASQAQTQSPSKSAKKAPFDPMQRDLAWVPETLVRLAAPQALRDWDAKKRTRGDKLGQTGSGTTDKKTKKDAEVQRNALDAWLMTTNAVVMRGSPSTPAKDDECAISKTIIAPTTATATATATIATSTSRLPRTNFLQPTASSHVNPWTLSAAGAGSIPVTKSSLSSPAGTCVPTKPKSKPRTASPLRSFNDLSEWPGRHDPSHPQQNIIILSSSDEDCPSPKSRGRAPGRTNSGPAGENYPRCDKQTSRPRDRVIGKTAVDSLSRSLASLSLVPTNGTDKTSSHRQTTTGDAEPEQPPPRVGGQAPAKKKLVAKFKAPQPWVPAYSLPDGSASLSDDPFAQTGTWATRHRGCWQMSHVSIVDLTGED